jgi:hypothetical protein
MRLRGPKALDDKGHEGAQSGVFQPAANRQKIAETYANLG